MAGKLEGGGARATVEGPPEAVLDPVHRKGIRARAQVDVMLPTRHRDAP